jgi:hypothetical protein
VRQVYIYYRIDPAQADVAARAADALLARLAPYCSTPPLRLTRCEDPALWMEVYAGIADPAAFAGALDAALDALPARDWIVGARHLESFCPPSVPAPGA